MVRIAGFVLFVTLAIAGLGRTQTALAQTDPAAEIAQLQASVPAAKPEDVASPEAIVKALYATISGPAGERDWNRLRSLLLPEGRFTASVLDDAGHHVVRRRNVEDYIAGAGHYFSEHPFYETGLVTKIQRFGNIAQVFTSYASSNAPGAKPFQRGINSMQLLNDGTRWWIVSILWDSERPENPLPKTMAK
jgi:hypothetical protein